MSARALEVLRRFGALVLVAAPLSAQGSASFSSPGPSAVLEAGTTVSLAWTLGSSGTPEIREMELVLSLDGGRSFPIRVTRDLGLGTRSLLLTVPSLPTSHARLALRAGDGDEPTEEEILAVSEEFAIEANARQPLEATVFVRGEWRTRETLDGAAPSGPPEAGAFGAGDSTLTSAAVRCAACSPRPDTDTAPTDKASAFETAIPPDLPTPVRPTRRTPAYRPLRE